MSPINFRRLIYRAEIASAGYVPGAQLLNYNFRFWLTAPWRAQTEPWWAPAGQHPPLPRDPRAHARPPSHPRLRPVPHRRGQEQAGVVRPDAETADCAIQAAKGRLAGGHG